MPIHQIHNASNINRKERHMKKQKPRKRKPQKNTNTESDLPLSTQQSTNGSSADILHRKPSSAIMQSTPENIDWRQQRHNLLR